MVTRACSALARLDQRLAAAKADGFMAFFNSQYRRRRLAALDAGRGFMSYRIAEQRLRKAIVGVAAGEMTPSLVARVFGGN
jgi:hypothetical protein